MEKTQILDALDRAIRAEHDAQAFYTDAAQTTDDAGGARMFRELAAFEAHHERHLRELKASLENSGAWTRYPAREFSKVPAAEGSTRKGPGGHADALEALRLAIAAEEKAMAEYEFLARGAPDEAGRQMFRRLAEEEAGHRRLLDDQYYHLLNRGVWVWGD